MRKSELLIFEIDAQAETAKLVEENVEGFGDTSRRHGVALNDSFVGFATTGDVVTLDGENLLEDVGGTECFECPNFHFSETLPTELSFTTERLLGDE